MIESPSPTVQLNEYSAVDFTGDLRPHPVPNIPIHSTPEGTRIATGRPATLNTASNTTPWARCGSPALWRAQTQRAVENFPISGPRPEGTQIARSACLAACAQVNKDLGLLSAEKADAIIAAAAEIADGKHDDQFPIDVFQTGSGTSSNMNANEVIVRSAAGRDGVTVHPNDDVNMSQSSNDTFPTATHIAATEAAVRQLIPALGLHESLAVKARLVEEHGGSPAART